ncbi:MAG: hypothetical protein ACI8S6_004012 [Myxococcota bacterium]|jgi:hypothetical protein
MSQTYRCKLKASVQQTVTLGDSIRHSLALTEILPAEEMKDLLRGVLREHGFDKEDEGDRWIISQGRETTTVDLDQMEVVTTREEEKTLRTDASAHGAGWSTSEAQQSARDNLVASKEVARQRLKDEGVALQRSVTEAVSTADSEGTELIHTLLQEVYAESLKRKARQLGDVVEITEGTTASGEYELIIKVET